MRSVLKLVPVVLLAALAGCAATGPRYSEVAASFPRLAPGEGRVFFYRDSMMGAALAPDVRVDGRVVAPMKPGSFFFVDVPAGRHTASASTEVDSSVDFTASDNDPVYIRVSIGMGLVVGRPHLAVRTAVDAKQALPSLAYGGARQLAPGSAAPSAKAPDARPSQAGVSMDDLRGLLPAKP